MDKEQSPTYTLNPFQKVVNKDFGKSRTKTLSDPNINFKNYDKCRMKTLFPNACIYMYFILVKSKKYIKETFAKSKFAFLVFSFLVGALMS